MPFPTHYLTCLSVEEKLKADPLCKVIVNNRGGYSNIIFRKRFDEIGLDLIGFDWYVRKGSFGLSIQNPFNAKLALETLRILFPYGVTVTDGDGKQHTARWHETVWNSNPAVQLVFEGTEQGQDFPQTEFGEYRRAAFRGNMLEQLILQTLPIVKVLVSTKIAAQLTASKS